MSSYERIKGKLIPISENIDLEKFKKWLYNNDHILDTSKSFSIYDWDSDKEFIYHEGIVYKIEIIERINPYGPFCNLSKDNKNGIDFDTLFYNGGTYLTEMLEEGLNLNKGKIK